MTAEDVTYQQLLLAEIAHELARPLTRILNETVRLQSRLTSADLASVKKIEEEAQRAAQILSGFSTLPSHQPLTKTPVNVAALIGAAEAALGWNDPTAFPNVRKRHRFEDNAYVPADAQQLQQVFINLMQNALDAMPAGGDLTISVRPAWGALEIVFEDTGAGIPLHLRERVFEPFFTTKKSKGGRGVGLTLCRAMVERHGGTLFVESPVVPKNGTRVIVSLPLDTKEGQDGA
jgi:signal transduction histidine kinase